MKSTCIGNCILCLRQKKFNLLSIIFAIIVIFLELPIKVLKIIKFLLQNNLILHESLCYFYYLNYDTIKNNKIEIIFKNTHLNMKTLKDAFNAIKSNNPEILNSNIAQKFIDLSNENKIRSLNNTKYDTKMTLLVIYDLVDTRNEVFMKFNPPTSRYAIYGMPYFNKSFDFASYGNEIVNETENYLLRLPRTRRDYLPNRVYTPYFYAKTTSWYHNNTIYGLFNRSENFVTSVDILLSNMNRYRDDLYFINLYNLLFLPSNFNTNSFSKAFWQPSFSIQSYYYNVFTLVDILTKRKYLYRWLFFESNKLINLLFYLINNLTNPLINGIKSTFLLIDFVTYNNEYSRDIYYSPLAFFNFNVIKSIFVDSGEFFGFSKLSNYLFFCFLMIKIIILWEPIQLYLKILKDQCVGVSLTSYVYTPRELLLCLLKFVYKY